MTMLSQHCTKSSSYVTTGIALLASAWDARVRNVYGAQAAKGKPCSWLVRRNRGRVLNRGEC